MTVTTDLVFEEPPPVKRVNKVWMRRLKPLMEHPEKWVRLPGDFHRNTAAHLRRKLFLIPPGRWEFQGRRIPESDMHRVRVWGRYLGPEES